MKGMDSSGKVGFAATQYGKESQYWLNKFSGELKKSCFPYDRPDETPEQEQRDCVKFEVFGQSFEKLTALSKGMDHRLYIILTAGLVALLHKYTGDNDIIVGSPISRQEVEGDFINTVLALRNQLDEGISFKELLLNRVRPTVIEASEHMNYPIETLLYQLNMPISRKRFPLFDVVILLENIHEKKYILHTRPNLIFSFMRTGTDLEGTMDYNCLLYEKETAERIVRHFKGLLERVLENIDLPIARIDILGADEKKQLLEDFNATQTEYPSERTIDALFEEQASRVPGQTAVTFNGEPLTYRELNEQADRLAARLRSSGIFPGEPVALMAENSSRVCVALLAILKAGGTYIPVNVQYPPERKKYILGDCHTRIMLTNCPEFLEENMVSTVIHLDDDLPCEENVVSRGNRGGDDPVYIMYTSGSTGMPKGVLVIHRNVVRLVKNTNFVTIEEGDSILLTGALEFDASTFEIWGSLLNGLTLHLVDKDTILNESLLKEALQRNGVTTIWMTSPLFNQMLDTDIEIFEGLKNLLVGGDALSPMHINRVRSRFPRLNVINGYGPTENTTFSVTHRIDREYKENIPIGRPIANSTAYIVDRGGQLVPVGVPGELWVGGDGVALGYLNNPELTARSFTMTDWSNENRRSYRTGDLARWLHGGLIEFLGRLDQQVKIRGYRVEPGEIENRIMQLDFVEEAVVVARKTRDGEKYLCAYIVTRKLPGGESPAADPGEMKRILLEKLPDYMVPAYFVQMNEIPLTTNGKVDRRALPEPETGSGGAAYVAPRNRVEEKMAEIWAAVLGIEKERIGIDSDFFECGGHSLKATILISRIHKVFEVKIPLAELFRTPTIRELAEYIEGLTVDRFSSIRPAEEKEYYELSSAQKRLYILQQMELEVTTYNIPYVLRIEGDLDRGRMEDSFRQMISRHESLRTSFEMVNGEPCQKIHRHVAFEIEEVDPLSPVPVFVRPFDLSRPPLLRVGLREEGEGIVLLLVDIHHIVTDGTSMDLFVKELTALYAGKELTPLPFQYKDFACWQNSEEQREAVRKQEEYWLRQFDSEIPVLDLPTDFTRPAAQSFEGNTVLFELTAEETAGLNRLALRGGVTLYMTVFAVVYVLLSKLSGQEDIIVGTPVAARRHTDLERIIGMFVNTLALRNYPSDEKIFTFFLREVKERVLQAFENQEYQFEDLVEQVLVTRDPARNPLFDVSFSLENMEAQTEDIPLVEIPGLKMISDDNKTSTSKFDMLLTCIEVGEKLLGSFQYCTKLFREGSVRRFVDYFRRIIRVVLKTPETRLSDIEMISEEEKKQVLYDFNDTATPYPRHKTIPQIFEVQAEKVPDRIAVVAQDMTFTYRVLNGRANRLAYRLIEKEVRSDTIVGIIVDRSFDMMVGIFAILKAGGAYLPVEPGFPQERISYMLNDARAGVILLQEPHAHKITGDIDRIDMGQDEVYRGRTGNPAVRSKPEDLAYIIYTSGTTGKPKGTLTTHYNVVRIVIETNYIEFTGRDRVLQLSNYAFDGSVFDIYGALLNGAVLVIIEQADVPAVDPLSALIMREQVSAFFITTSLFNMLVDLNIRCLKDMRKVMCGGERLSAVHIAKAFKYLGGGKIINGYGPTETTVFATYYPVDQAGDEVTDIPIGKPVSNTGIYILDRSMKPVPVGIKGEILIGGYGVARGYLNRPGLTGERFIPNPFVDGDVLYRSGDLGRWMPDGNIEFFGRIDRQVKIRGFRIELGEVEHLLVTIPPVIEAVVIVPDGEEKQLCAYIVSDQSVDIAGLRKTLSSLLPAYMIPSYFMQIDRVPLTPNGKVDRKKLPLPIVAGEERYASPENAVQETLIRIWNDLLNITPAHPPIGIDADFFQLGGHSLKATILSARIHKAFNVKIPLIEIFTRPTVRGISKYLENTARDKYAGIEAVEKREYYTLSSAQKRLYLLQQMDAGGIGYNIPMFLSIEGEIDNEGIGRTFAKLIKRHESLRTSFKMVNEIPVQMVHDSVEFQVEKYDSGFRVSRFVRPFDLSRAPLLRVGLVTLEREKYYLLIDIHHIVTDGTSMSLLVKEFTRLYTGSDPVSLRLQYKDYTLWQNKELGAQALKAQEEYWLRQFHDEVPVLHLPLDFPRPPVQIFEGNTLEFVLSRDRVEEFRRFAVREGATLFMAMFSVTYIFLARLSGQEDIVVGTPVAGRRHADLQEIIGMFVNTLAVRCSPGNGKSFTTFLTVVKQQALDAFENQEYQFEDLVEKVVLKRDAGRNPLFDVTFSLHDMEGFTGGIPAVEIPGVKITPYESENTTAKFDLSIICEESSHGLNCSFQYCTKLFKEETIRRFMQYYENIVSAILDDPDRLLSTMEMISEEERREILYDFSQRGDLLPNDKTISQLFDEQYEKTPNNVAIVGITPEGKRRELTYRELNDHVVRLAGYLGSMGIEENGMIGLLVNRCIEMIVGILGILKAGCAYIPLNPKAPAARSRYILEECCAKCLAATHDLTAAADFGMNTVYLDDDLHYDTARPDTNILPPSPRVSDYAYVIFTSGSTGKPKGVPVTHSNFSPLIHWGYRELGIGPEDRFIQNLSYYFDWSVWEIVLAVTTGAGLYVVPDELLLNPAACIPFMNENRITVLHITPSQYLYFINTGQRLETLKYLFLGAEKLSVDLLRRSLESVDEGCRVFNMYGPTECTIITAVLEIDRSGEKTFENISSIPIGIPVGNTALHVLDHNLNLCPINVTGELYISGDCVSRGYLNRPELTSEVFNGFGRFDGVNRRNTVFYKTGDLVRWLPDGNIEFFGRIDLQVKIRGFRIELGEIEARLVTHPSIREALVIDLQKENGEKYLCAYIISRKPVEPAELKEYLSGSLPDYMIPSHVIFIDNIPLNPNGKLDRGALPRPEVRGGEEYAAPSGEIEERLADLWADVLNLEKETIGARDDFFELGGHSLKAAVLTARIARIFRVNIPLTRVFTFSTVREMAQCIRESEEGIEVRIEPAEKREYYPLASAQKRLYILQQMESLGTVYNMPHALSIRIPLEVKKLEGAFKQLIERHESLRTSFRVIHGEPVQEIHDEVEFRIEYLEETGGSASAVLRREAPGFFRFFDLSTVPLLRTRLIKLGEREYLFLMDMHHIITDGVSQGIFVKELMSLYAGEVSVPPLTRYVDYALWQRNEKPRLKKQEDFWINEFRDEVPVLDLPYDFPRPVVQSFAGKTAAFIVEKEDTAALNTLASDQGVTLYMLLLGIFYIFLSKLGSREDIVVGTPTAGRKHSDLENVIGMFVNTLALRNFPSGEKTFVGFLDEVGNRTLEAFENQEYQFEDLVEAVSLKRETSRNAVFDVMFNFRNRDDRGDAVPDVEPVPFEFETDISKFDITLTAAEEDHRLLFIFEYCTKLFTGETIGRFTRYFKRIVRTVLDNPGVRISKIEIISEEEKEQILYRFNDTGVPYPHDKTIHQLFCEQAGKTPGKAAVVFEGETLTYRELDRRSDLMASILTRSGVDIETVVGIMLPRSIDMVLAVLAVLKAGGVYLPINTDYPEERINYMLVDSRANVLLINSEKALNIRNRYYPPVVLNFEHSNFEFVSNFEFRASDFSSSNLAYIIYTSGTTGKPKGTMVEHRNVVRLVKNSNFVDFSREERLLQTGALEFDASTFEIWGSLLNGWSLFLTDRDKIVSASLLKETVRKYAVSIMWLTSPLFNQLCRSDVGIFEELRYLLVGGDILSPSDIARVREVFPSLNVINGYGPTENTTFSTTYLIEDEYAGAIPIGRPIANSTAFVVDSFGYLQPLGVPGELHVGGDGVSRGYLNAPELTAEKFYRSYWGKTNRSYRTGDLARWLPDGNIEFLERIDRQVKIRGFRVELGEIENCLLKLPHINKVVVVDVRGDRDEKFLCAYIVSSQELDITGLRGALSPMLPDYMIPSHFVRVEQIPLTPNGKVDRRALPLPEVPGRDDYTPPENEIQERLIRIWADILNIDLHESPIGIDQDFFQLGGHSLKAALMKSGIDCEFMVRVPLVQVFSTPTIRGLAAYIEETGKETAAPGDSRLVHLRKNSGDRAPLTLFLVHDGFGGVDGYGEFCSRLNSAIECWGIKAEEYESSVPSDIQIETIARDYIQLIKRVQPEGPYSVAGWSVGGTIAFEMVRQFEAAGEEIAFCALIDTLPPQKEGETGETRAFWEAAGTLLEDPSMDTERIRERVPAEISRGIPGFDRLPAAELIRHLNIVRSLHGAAIRYIPSRRVKSPVHFFWAGRGHQVDKEAWHEYAVEPVAFIRVEGDHFSIMKKPDVEIFVKQFGSVLEI